MREPPGDKSPVAASPFGRAAVLGTSDVVARARVTFITGAGSGLVDSASDAAFLPALERVVWAIGRSSIVFAAGG